MAHRMFGEIAFEMGFVNTDQLYRALTVQAKAEAEKRPYKFLGQILIDLGYMTERQVLEVLKVLHRSGPKKATAGRARRKR